MEKEITLINKLHETSITINIPFYVYTNYVLMGDNAEIDWWLIDIKRDNPKQFDKIKSILCPNETIEDIEGLYHDIILGDNEDNKFMIQKEEEIKKLMGEHYRGELT